MPAFSSYLLALLLILLQWELIRCFQGEQKLGIRHQKAGRSMQDVVENFVPARP